MKFLVLLALVSVAFAAPQPRKIFHDNVWDFIDLINEEAGHELDHILEHYEEYEEFMTSANYLRTTNFKDLVYEMESLPEFKDVQAFLDTHSIDISYFLDLLNSLIESGMSPRKARHTTSGRDFDSYVRDCTAEFPKAKLAALYDQKLVEDDEFRAAIQGLESDEFIQLWEALWSNSVFQAEIQALADHGIHVEVLLDQVVAIFGQEV